MMPEDWKSMPLGEILDFKNGLNTEKSNYGSGFKFINVMDIFRNSIITESTITGKVEVSEKQLSDYLVKTGDILFNRTSETFDEIAMSAVYMGAEPVTFGGFVIRGRPTNSILRADFSAYVFQSKKFRAEVIKKGQGVIRANIGQKDLASIRILVPPHSEQKKIAQILTTWDEAISTTKKLINNSTKQKKSLAQSLLSGNSRFSKFIKSNEQQKTKYGKVPVDWRMVTIGEIANQFSKKNTTARDVPVLSCSKHKGFVDSLKYFNKKVYSDDTSTYKVIEKGCFGFPSNHIEEGSIGYQDLYDTGLVSPIYIVFKTNTAIVNDKFLYLLLKTEHYRQIFSAATNSSVDRRGSLRWNEFSKIKIQLPTLEEQNAIAAAITKSEHQTQTLNKKLICLQQERKFLMQQLLSGDLRVGTVSK